MPVIEHWELSAFDVYGAGNDSQTPARSGLRTIAHVIGDLKECLFQMCPQSLQHLGLVEGYSGPRI